MALSLSGKSLTIENIEAVARRGEKVELHSDARARTSATLEGRHRCHYGLKRLPLTSAKAARASLGCPHVPVNAPRSPLQTNLGAITALSDRSNRQPHVAKLCWAYGHVHLGVAYFPGVN